MSICRFGGWGKRAGFSYGGRWVQGGQAERWEVLLFILEVFENSIEDLISAYRVVIIKVIVSGCFSTDVESFNSGKVDTFFSETLLSAWCHLYFQRHAGLLLDVRILMSGCYTERTFLFIEPGYEFSIYLSYVCFPTV